MSDHESDPLKQMLEVFNQRYNNDQYRRADGSWMDDEDGFGHGAAHRLLERAQHLTGAARAQFVTAYSFACALEGGVYVWGGVTAKIKYPDLCSQGPALGIRLFGRGEGFETVK